MHSQARFAAVLVTAFVAAACGAGPVSQATSQAPASGAVPPSASPSSPVSAATWISPDDGARVEATALDLAATITPPPGVSIVEVSFIATSANGETPACAATKPGTDGTWRCRADLLASGVAVGDVSLSLLVTAADGRSVDTTAGPRAFTYAVLPPQPANPTYTLVKDTPHPDGTSTQEYRLTWTAPKGYAVAFLAYGLTECLRYAKENDQKPCVVRGMKIPPASLELLQQVPGDARSMTLTFTVGELGGNGYWAILIRATNDFGDSIFTIADSGIVCFECTY